MGNNGNFTEGGQNGNDDVGWFRNVVLIFTGPESCRLFTLSNGTNNVALLVRYS
jgi:hypothetical protein